MLLYVYVFCMVLYILQLENMPPIVVRIMNIIQLVIQTGFFWNEYIQYKDASDEYFKSFFNWIDLFHFFTFLIYFGYRMYDT